MNNPASFDTLASIAKDRLDTAWDNAGFFAAPYGQTAIAFGYAFLAFAKAVNNLSERQIQIKHSNDPINRF